MHANMPATLMAVYQERAGWLLYERIEIMEEDGVPLTKVNAEDLIEEAADKAENPSFIKRIRNILVQV